MKPPRDWFPGDRVRVLYPKDERDGEYCSGQIKTIEHITDDLFRARVRVELEGGRWVESYYDLWQLNEEAA